MTTPRVLIVIVNYRTAELAIDCLQSLARDKDLPDGTQVTVTDNASGDDSVARLREAIETNGWASWVSLRPLDQNGGFSYGNNAAIRPALAGARPPDYFLLLNPDTLVRPGAIGTLVDFLDQHDAAGIAGSRLEAADGQVQVSAFRFPTVLGELEGGLRLGVVSRLLERFVVAPPPPATPCRVDWVAGASMLIRRQVFAATGLLDEGYFMYFDEVDFCRRAGRAGFGCWYVPDSRVVHLVGQASGVTDPRRPCRRRPGYWFESRRRYFLKHQGRVRAALADGAFLAGFALWRIRRVLQRRQDTDPQHLLADFARHSVFARGFQT